MSSSNFTPSNDTTENVLSALILTCLRLRGSDVMLAGFELEGVALPPNSFWRAVCACVGVLAPLLEPRPGTLLEDESAETWSSSDPVVAPDDS